MSPALRNLVISGATGPVDMLVNGVWNRSAEVAYGQPVYFKRDRPDKCLQYHAPNSQWVMRSLASRGTVYRYAFVDCEAGVPLEKCSNAWRVGNGVSMVSQPVIVAVQTTPPDPIGE